MLIRLLGRLMRYFRRRLRRLSKYIIPAIIAAILVLGYFKPALEKAYHNPDPVPSSNAYGDGSAPDPSGLNGSLAPASTSFTGNADPELGDPGSTSTAGPESSNQVTGKPLPAPAPKLTGATQCFQLLGPKLTSIVEPALKVYLAFPTGQPANIQLAALKPVVTPDFYTQTSASWLLPATPLYLTTKVVMNSCTIGITTTEVQHLIVNVDVYTIDGNNKNYDDNTTYDVSVASGVTQVANIVSYRPVTPTEGG